MAVVSVTSCSVDVRIEGDVDLANGDQLRDVLTASLVDHRPRRLRLDLSSLAFVDGGGRRTLRQFLDYSRLAGVRVSLTAPDVRAVRLSLEMGGLQFGEGADEAADLVP
jgi:anti-anti-sigma factor